MIKREGKLLGLALVGLSLFGCRDEVTPTPAADNDNHSQESQATVDARDAAVRTAIEMDRAVSRRTNEVEIMQQWHFPGAPRVMPANSWEEALSQLPAEERAWLQDRNEHYAGALAFRSSEEQSRMIAQGFPMPEEWLAARNLPDTELERLAKTGNRKAQMFFVDRISDEIGPIRKSGRGLNVSSSPQDKALFSKVADASSRADELLRSTRSPYAAYLRARISTAMTQYNPPEGMASAIMLAGDLGDRRAQDLLARYILAHPNTNMNEALQSYARDKRLILGQSPPPSH